jgi:3-hydroxy-9,10-secoandrosta-1,3,5(10)-triene-9,17-dione monooxygenase reductase component
MSHDAPPAPVSPAVLREVLGHFVSGIVVVTAAGREFDPAAGREIDTAAAGHAGPLGFTCQSFASLSLDPPLVSLAPARTSSTWPRIRAVGAFCVNVLAAEHADVSVAFARSGVDKFAGVAWTPAPSGAPVLHGVSAWVDCELWAEYDGGDHTIAVGRVLDLSADPTRPPLLYYRGRYGVAASEN